MEQDLHTWAVEARANGNRTDQPDELAARWFDLADDLDALVKVMTPAQDAEQYDNNHAPCTNCGEGCDPRAATPTQWQCSDCFNWNDKSQA
jgi:hypothetical protein